MNKTNQNIIESFTLAFLAAFILYEFILPIILKTITIIEELA